MDHPGTRAAPKGSSWKTTYLLREQRVSPIIKSIVNPRRIAASRSTHHWLYRNDELASDESERPVKGSSSAPAAVEILRINHYWSKSLEDGKNKIARGAVDDWALKNPRPMELWYKFDAACNAVEDREILRFVPEPKRRLEMRRAVQAQRKSDPRKSTAMIPFFKGQL